jgi:predicted regulator of amino acid metabolism with ACT domain
MNKRMEHFERFPSQEKVARLLLKHGLRVHDGRAWCGEIELSDTALGRAADVDRRVVKAALETIESNPRLLELFSNLRSTPLFSEVASLLGGSSIEIIPDDAQTPGILADVAGVMADAGISIRQAMVDDPEMSEEPRLYVITESPVPPEILPKIKGCRGVKSILIH